jgi:nitric oxide reductase large subunit
MSKPIFDILVWMWMQGDLIFISGSILLALFVIGQWTIAKKDK